MSHGHAGRVGWTALPFAANGALYGSLLARYPEIANRVHASEGQFGLALFAAASGGLAGSLLARLVVARTGEVSATVISGCAYAVLACAVAWAPRLWPLAAALLLTGVFDGMHDVAMNAFAVRVQQPLGISIMGRMHGVWSLSLAGAGLLGAGAASLRIPILPNIVAVAALAFAAHVALLWIERPTGAAAAPRPTPVERHGPPGLPPLRGFLLVLGVAAFAASYIESPGQEWTGILLGRGFGAGPGLAASAPVAFSLGLVISRLVLDGSRQRYGGAAVSLASAATITLAMLGGLLIAAVHGSALWALAAVALGGFGAGPVFPLLFGAADALARRYGTAPATTAATVSALSRIGAISAPVAVGFLTGALGLSMVFAVMAAGGVALLATLPKVAR